MPHSPDKTMNVAVELQQFLDETLVAAADDVSDGVEVNEPDNPESMMIFQLRKGGLIYDIQVLPASDWREEESTADTTAAAATG